MFIVTIKLPKNPQHNPHNKIIGPCEVSDYCTDSTGEHHSVLVDSVETVEAYRNTYRHITRVEKVGI